MSTADHVAQLTEKHHRIEEKIENEMAEISFGAFFYGPALHFDPSGKRE